MTPSQSMTAEADAAAQRYGMLVDGWHALYLQMAYQSNFGTPRQFSDISTQAYTIARHYLDAEANHIAAAFQRLALEAQQTTQAQLGVSVSSELTDDASEHLSECVSYLQRELLIQVERDIALLQQAVRKRYISVTISARAQRVSPRIALMQHKISKVGDIDFATFDRRNNRWPSRRFVRSMWRMNILALYNEIVLLTLADHGVDRAFVTYMDAKSTHHGTEISMNAGTSLPVYEDIKVQVFHPNSEAILSGVL